MTSPPPGYMAPRLEAPSILIVDDETLQLRLMDLLLQQAFPGAATQAIDDPAAALASCRSTAFDCVVIDYQMPGMDGLACARVLRDAFPHLPIVLCTGGGDEMLVAQAITGGVTQYIPKTRISPDALRRTILHAVQIMAQGRLIADQREELENFAYALAHDFRQPIRQIKTFTSLISDSLQRGDTTEVDRHLAFLNDAAGRLGRLVDVMSQYTLLGRSPEIGMVDLRLMLERLSGSIQPFIDEREGRLVYDGAQTVLGNEVLMGQVLQNLVVNGMKYNRSARPTVEVACRDEGETCLISVSDDGIGMEAKYLDEIFKPLHRLHTNAEYEGTGLGLAMARKAVIAQNGTIWCESEPGHGSTFFVRLPSVPVVAAAEQVSAA